MKRPLHKTCIHYEKTDRSNKGYCCRFPPKAIEGGCLYPLISKDDTCCGEHQDFPKYLEHWLQLREKEADDTKPINLLE